MWKWKEVVTYRCELLSLWRLEWPKPETLADQLFYRARKYIDWYRRRSKAEEGQRVPEQKWARGPSASTAGLRLLACFLIRTLPSPSLILPLFFQSVIHQQSLSMSGPVLAPDLGPGSQPTRMTREFSSQHACHSSATTWRQRENSCSTKRFAYKNVEPIAIEEGWDHTL